MGALHEMRHLIQLTSSGAYYYEELDSDLFARDTIRRDLPQLQINPAKHLQENIFARYAALLGSPSEYRIAPAIDAFETGKNLPREKKTGSALDKIRRCIIEKETGKYPKKRSEQEFLGRYENTPEVGYSLLRRCVEDGAFKDKNSTRIANRILESVEYFSEGLTRNPDIIRKIYPAGAAL